MNWLLKLQLGLMSMSFYRADSAHLSPVANHTPRVITMQRQHSFHCVSLTFGFSLVYYFSIMGPWPDKFPE